MTAGASRFWSPRNSLQGLTIYTLGDVTAQLLLHQLNGGRVLGVMALGATLYAIEIPNWFAFIDKRVTEQRPVPRALQRTALALAYFNPLWIARHLLFLRLFSGATVGVDLLRLGLVSWAANLPVAVLANWLIQVKIPLRWRFLASATFSGLMAIYYAASDVIWRH